MIAHSGDLQDGMLLHYLEQVKTSDVTVEARIEKEPFDFRWVNYGVTPPDRIAIGITPEWQRKSGNL